jgi:hypothetical protein
MSREEIEAAYNEFREAEGRLAAVIDAEFPEGAPVIAKWGNGYMHGVSGGRSFRGAIQVVSGNNRRHSRHFTDVFHQGRK